MPPKFKFTKEQITSTAIEIIRETGYSSLTARLLGQRLGASSKPIFGLFKSMDDVKTSVIERANEIFRQS